MEIKDGVNFEIQNKITNVDSSITISTNILALTTIINSKSPSPTFDADAGSDETIDRSQSVTITAAQINEAAVYNWYDREGNLIYTGTDLTVSPEVTKTYKLEIITDTDGYKDYDQVQVTVNPYRLESLVPNPATSQGNGKLYCR